MVQEKEYMRELCIGPSWDRLVHVVSRRQAKGKVFRMMKSTTRIWGASLLTFATLAAAAPTARTEQISSAKGNDSNENTVLSAQAETPPSPTIIAEESAKDAAERTVTTMDAAGNAAASADTVLVECCGVKLTAGQANKLIQSHLSMYEGRIPTDQVQQLIPRMQNQVKEQFIMRTLLKSATEKLDIEIDESEISKMIADTKQSLPQGMSFERFLTAQDLTEETLRDEVRTQLQVRHLMDQKLGDELTPKEEEISEFYEQQKGRMNTDETVHAGHILIKFDDSDGDKAKQAKRTELESIREQLIGGAEFAQLAKEKSHCPSSANGGDLGTFGRGQMVPEFENAAFTQDVGNIGEIVETKFGYHIIQVMEKNEGGERSLDEVHDEIKEYLSNQRRGMAFKEYVEELRAAADIKYPN